MRKLTDHTQRTAICLGLITLMNCACAAETNPRDTAAAQAQIPLTSQLSEVISGQYVLEHDHGRVHWSVGHHGFSAFMAVFPMNQATLEIDAKEISNSKLVATVDMTKVDTSIDAFDDRLQGAKFFNTEKYPTSTFTSTRIVDNGDNTMVVFGDLTFLGTTNTAEMQVAFRQAGYASSPPAGYRIGFDATMVINRSDFGMSQSTISDVVSLKIEAEFVRPQSDS